MIHLETALDIPFDLSLLEQAARAALDHQSADGDLTLVLADDEQLRRLNRDYLGVDAPTDVLSFPASETDPETGAPYLGDILLSVSRAAEQARAASHPLADEARLLVVHGVLHLLGHDHAEADEKAKMWKAQGEILDGLGVRGIKSRRDDMIVTIRRARQIIPKG
ncbi:MAG: rRNA maturation RNase YbeY [Anaerolineae bacterium CG1_02_58_13]|nr:MAG: rRNA maturation RNase YbeY [Anaerolineae bacterium CG1_02_58_13]